MDPPNQASLEGPSEQSPNTVEPVALASLEGDIDSNAASVVSADPVYTPKRSLLSRLTVPLLIVLIIAVPSILVFAIFNRTQRSAPEQQSSFPTQQINLKSLIPTATTKNLSGTLTVNGQLQVSPSAKPVNPEAGQIYYDKANNQLGYYNGKSFVYLQGDSPVVNNTINNNTTVVNNSTNNSVVNNTNTTINNTVNNVTNTTVVNNYTDPAPPAILLQGDTPGTVQTGDFAISGTGTIGVANIGTGNIATGTINTANIDVGNINTGNLGVGNITTATIGTATINTATVDTATIGVANITTANIGLVNTTQIDSKGNSFAINQYAAIPGGQPATAGYDQYTQSSNNDILYHFTKITTGGNGGTLKSVAAYINSWTTGSSVSIGVYTGDGNVPSKPGNLLWASGPVDADSKMVAGWNTITTPNITLSPFTDYWIGEAGEGVWYSYPHQVSYNLQTINLKQNSSCDDSRSPYATFFSYTLPSFPSCNLGQAPRTFYMNYITDPSTGGAGAMFSLTNTGQAAFRPTQDSLHAFRIQDAASGTTIFDVDSSNYRVGIGTLTPQERLDVSGGNINLTHGYAVMFNGNKTLSVSGNDLTTSLGNYSAGGAVALQGDSIKVQNAAGTTTYLTINGTNGAATFAGAAAFNSTLGVTGATTLSSTLGVTGATTLNGATAVNNTLTNKVTSATAFTVQDASAANLFVADTTNKTITIGSASNNAALYVNRVMTIPTATATTKGLNTVGSSTLNGLSGTQYATKITMGSTGGTLQSIAANLTGGVATNQIQYAIYADDGNVISKPSALLATSATANIVVGAVNTITLPSTTLSPYTSYWLAFNTNDAAVTRSYNTTGSNTTCSVVATFGTMTNPFGSGCTLSNNVFNIYANYTRTPNSAGGDSALSIDSTGKAVFRNTTDSGTAFQVQNAADGSAILNVDSTQGFVSIGKGSASYKLDVAGGDVNLSAGNALRFGGSQTLSVSGNGSQTTLSNAASGGAVNVQGDNFAVQTANGGTSYLTINTTTGATFTSTLLSKLNSTTAFRIQNTSAANLFIADTTNMVIAIAGTDTSYASLTLTDAHLKSTQTTAPTIAAPTNCGAGATSAIAAGSTDTAGSFTITSGTDSTASTCDTTITFRSAYGAAPKSIVITARNAATGQLGAYVAPATTTTFTISFSNGVAGANSTLYTFSYLVIE